MLVCTAMAVSHRAWLGRLGATAISAAASANHWRIIFLEHVLMSQAWEGNEIRYKSDMKSGNQMSTNPYQRSDSLFGRLRANDSFFALPSSFRSLALQGWPASLQRHQSFEVLEVQIAKFFASETSVLRPKRYLKSTGCWRMGSGVKIQNSNLCISVGACRLVIDVH